MRSTQHLFNWTCAGVLSLMVLRSMATEASKVAPLVKANTAFAMQLYSKVSVSQSNVVVSPYSVASALAMTCAGARGQTARQMEQALHFPTDTKALHDSFSRLDAVLSAARTNGVELDIANSLWPQNGDAFRAEFIDLLRQDYRATVTPLDYVHQREQARATINQWVDEKTHHKITAAIPPNTLSRLTSLVLVNAIYFKGEWDTAFPAHATRPDQFYPFPGKAITTPFMRVEGHFQFGEDEDLQWLALPYKGNRFQMVILLPRAGGIMEREFGSAGRGNGKRQRGSDTLEGLERVLNPAKFAAWTAALRSQKVAVIIPKFRISWGLRLNGALQGLGVRDAFNPERADFAGMDGRPHRLYLSDVLHQTFIDVSEKGTEAAAASAMAMTKSSPAMFYADHPFLFFIRESATGSILFMGRLADPHGER
jgi:serpin B